MPEFQTPEPITAVIDLTMGDLRIDAAERGETVVEVRPRDAASRADVRAAEQTQVEYAAGRLSIRTPRGWRSYSPFSGGGCVDVDVQLPAGSQVTADAAVAAIHGTGRLGDCRLKTAVGEIRLEQAESARLVTSAGNVSAGRVTGELEISTASGEVRVDEVTGTVVVKSSNGDTRIHEVAGDLRVKAANGDIHVERAAGSVTVKTANGEIRLGSVARGSVAAETGFGAVEVGIADGSAAWMDLHTSFGHVRNGLDAAQSPQPGEETVEVRARTGFGDITINRCGTAAAVEGGR